MYNWCITFYLSLKVSTNGLISFGIATYPYVNPTLFTNESTGFIAAPYWADIDNSFKGEIWYETHTAGENSTGAGLLLARVSGFIRQQQNDRSFEGTWMLVATWNESFPSISEVVYTMIVCPAWTIHQLCDFTAQHLPRNSDNEWDKDIHSVYLPLWFHWMDQWQQNCHWVQYWRIIVWKSPTQWHRECCGHRLWEHSIFDVEQLGIRCQSNGIK